MAKQSGGQKKTIGRVMHESKQGELETQGGRKVKNPKQAIAIALHEAGASNQESPAKNRHNLQRTKARERKAQAGTGGAGTRGSASGKAASSKAGSGQTRQDLYEEAKRRDVPGRSKMSKAELERALRR